MEMSAMIAAIRRAALEMYAYETYYLIGMYR